MITIEACVDSLASAMAAQQGGADRVELCDNLADAGTTPSHAVIEMAVDRLEIPVFPIIRVRGGGFVYTADEIEVMRRDILHAKSLGVAGVVIGALTKDGDIARDTVHHLRDAAGDLLITFHRAIDVARDYSAALEQLIELGIHRVLTSGQRASAIEGASNIANAVRQSAGRIIILAGGGIDENNAAQLVRETGVKELHVRGTTMLQEPVAFHEHPVPFRKNLPVDETQRAITDPARLQRIRAAIS